MKATSPKINNIIIFGAILCYLSTILQVHEVDPIHRASLMLLICRVSHSFLSYTNKFSKTMCLRTTLLYLSIL